MFFTVYFLLTTSEFNPSFLLSYCVKKVNSNSDYLVTNFLKVTASPIAAIIIIESIIAKLMSPVLAFSTTVSTPVYNT